MQCVYCELLRDSVVEGAIEYLHDVLDLDEKEEEIRTAVETSIESYCDEFAERHPAHADWE